MNIYYKIAAELQEFHQLKQKLPKETLPIQIRENYKQNPNISDIHYIQRKDRNIREAQEEATRQAQKSANSTKINGSSFLKYRDSLIKQALTFLERTNHELDLDSSVSLQQCIEVFDAIHLCDKDNVKQQETIQKLYYTTILNEDNEIGAVFTITTLLQLIQSIIAIPLQKSTNDEIQNYIIQNRDMFDKITKLNIYPDILNLTSHHIYVKQRKVPFEYVAQLSTAEKELQYECTFQPKLISSNNDHLTNKHAQRVAEQLQEFNIQEAPAKAVEDRMQQFRRLQQARLQQRQLQQQQDQMDFQYQPKLSNFNKKLYESVKLKQAAKNSNLLSNIDDDFLLQQLQQERSVIHSPAKQQQEQYTFQPKIGSVNPNVFKSVTMPRGFEKTVERLKRGQKERLEAQNTIENMGRFDEKKQKLLTLPIKQSVHEYNANIRTERHIQRREMLKQAEIDINGKKATVKFYLGDTIDEHLGKLIKLFAVKKNDELGVKNQLMSQFEEYTSESIARKKLEAAEHVKRQKELKELKYDPLFDSIGVPTVDQVYKQTQLNASVHCLNMALENNLAIQQLANSFHNSNTINYNDNKIVEKSFQVPDENGNVFRGDFGFVDQNDPLFM